MQKKIEDEGMLNVTIDTSSRWNSGLQRLIAGARLVVSPSEWPAPMEYVTLEAMSFGKAVIASDIGGHRSVISSGRNGLLFKAGDSDSLMNEITKLYENDKLCGELGRGALLTIKDEFDPKVFYRDVICILSSAMAENY
jgi:glycosyltransferase involved in cell wall biosynthesis